MDEELTLSEIVGRNVRRIRETRGWSQQRLRDQLDGAGGVPLSRASVALTELGKRPINVNELGALGYVLGVAPHLLLYPPPDSQVRVGQVIMSGEDLAQWLWDPDHSGWSRFPESEQRLWLLSSGLIDRLDSNTIDRLTAAARAAEEQTSKRQHFEDEAMRLGDEDRRLRREAQ